MPSMFTCCKPDWRRRSFEMMREKIEKEINIVNIVQSRRYFNLALEELLTYDQRRKLREKSRYIVVDPSSDFQQEDKHTSVRKEISRHHENRTQDDMKKGSDLKLKYKQNSAELGTLRKDLGAECSIIKEEKIKKTYTSPKKKGR